MLKKTYRLLSFVTGFFLLSAVVACSSDHEVAPRESSNYINLTLYVSGGSSVTRAPQGGETGDGTEAGFIRENEVKGITLVLSKGADLTDENAVIDFVAYYPVNLVEKSRVPQGTVDVPYEASYTTGDQKVSKDDIDFTETYQVLIIANRDLTNRFSKNTKVSRVLEYITENDDELVTNYTGPDPYLADNFLMTSESKGEINFGGMTPVPVINEEDNTYQYYYRVDNLLVERMIARIDYSAANATYDATRGGYRYGVTGSTEDAFVLKKITPFNIYNEPTYYFKRVRNSWDATVAPTIEYLGAETKTNYVVDPKTASKDKTTNLNYLSPLAADVVATSVYTQTLASEYQQTAKFKDANGIDTHVIAYAPENTLLPTSQLKKYATGLAFEGDYYVAGSTTPKTYTYYIYLRHQGEKGADERYQAQFFEDLNDDEVSANVAMNFGIVRNNIYRVNIVSVRGGRLEVQIAVHDWRNVENPEIIL